MGFHMNDGIRGAGSWIRFKNILLDLRYEMRNVCMYVDSHFCQNQKIHSFTPPFFPHKYNQPKLVNEPKRGVFFVSLMRESFS